MAVLLSPVGGVAGQFFDNNGNPLSGGKMYSYVAGTTTPQAAYTSSSGVTAHSNPIVLDSGGRVPGGEIWLTDGLQYKFVLKTSTDVLIGTYDNIVGINSNFVNFLTETEVQTATASQTVFTLTTMQYQPGTNNLSVFVDGVNQIDGATYSYVETSSTVVTFTSGLHVGALVKFTTAQTLSTGVTDASLVIYQPAGTGAVATTVQTKLRESVSVFDYMTTVQIVDVQAGTLTQDITVAINAALTDSSSLYFPDGYYKITASLNVTKNHNLFGNWSSDAGARIRAVACNAFNVVGKNTKIENFRVYQDVGYYAFVYSKPIGETSSFNNINNNNYVSSGGAFNLVDFSRSVITNFNSSELTQGVYLSGGVCVNVAISDSLFQGHGNPAVNVTGEFALKADIGSGGSKEGVNFTNVKFVSFFDGFINNNLNYSTFESCIFDYINNSGYTNTGYNINITFSNCYFGQQGYVAFPVVNGYSAFINPLSLPALNYLYLAFNTCFFVCYDAIYGPQVLANVREKNMGVSFTGCTDNLSQGVQSVALVSALNCVITNNIVFKEVTASGTYSATTNYAIDKTSNVVVPYQGNIREFSSRSELLVAANSNSGTLTSQIMTVTAANPTKVFKVIVNQISATYGSTKEYLVYMDYVLNASVTSGIVLQTTVPLQNGDLNRITPTLSATTANTNKTMSFVWMSNITPLISISRVL